MRRVLSYRKVAGLPLVVVVGLGEEEVLASFYDDALKYIAAGVAITILVILVMGASIRHRQAINKAYLALRRSEIVAQARKTELRAALENIEQGLLMVDAEGTVTVINRRAIELLDLPEQWLAAGSQAERHARLSAGTRRIRRPRVRSECSRHADDAAASISSIPRLRTHAPERHRA